MPRSPAAVLLWNQKLLRQDLLSGDAVTVVGTTVPRMPDSGMMHHPQQQSVHLPEPVYLDAWYTPFVHV